MAVIDGHYNLPEESSSIFFFQPNVCNDKIHDLHKMGGSENWWAHMLLKPPDMTAGQLKPTYCIRRENTCGTKRSDESHTESPEILRFLRVSDTGRKKLLAVETISNICISMDYRTCKS
jgi:hypothetical protein